MRKKVHEITLKYTAADKITVHRHREKQGGHSYLDMSEPSGVYSRWESSCSVSRTARVGFAKTTDSVDIDGPPSSTSLTLAELEAHHQHRH